ncbi:MAG: AMP-binding protein [Sinobacteraceae bacterium]|nr:AMP-binding protein [Nevskiaceae bacterium]
MRHDSGGWALRWNEAVAAAARAGGDWPDRTVADFARASLATRGGETVLIDGGVSRTRAEIYDAATRLASWLIGRGLRPGDVISFQLPNWWEASVIDIAAALSGVVVNPIVPINRDAEVTYMLNESATRVFFVPTEFRRFDYAAMFGRIRASLRRPPELVTLRGRSLSGLAFEELLAACEPLIDPPQISADAVKLLMYTSGTTGRPKGVLHSHNTIHADGVKMKPAMGLVDGDRTFCPSPVTHISGYLWGLNMPWAGNLPAVLLDVWEPERAFDLITEHGCAFSVGATPFLQDLMTVARRRQATLASMKSFMCGGASVPPALIYEAAERMPNCIPYRTFGATESPTMCGPPRRREDLALAAETDGRLLRAEVRIVDLVTGKPVGPGEEGEILVREPSMALGYARAEDNVDAYDADGFFRMGDLGRLVQGDHVVCTGRKKDLIIRAGENISAREIEDVLYRSDRVAEVAVVSMPSARTGEAICAFVVPRPDATLDLDDVSGWIREAGLARQKTPEHVELVTELPKTPSGKVRKDLLRERAKTLSASR